MTAIERVLSRIADARAARAADLAAGVAAPISAGQRIGAAHMVGARVFDPVTGQEGIVLGSSSENILGSTPRR